MQKTFINYAHRGASAYAPENTMASFRLGLEMNANGIETDVHRTADGVLVLFHDKNLKRKTGEDCLLKKKTYAELQELRVHMGDQAEPIPTLEEFCREFSGRDIQFAIELKQDDIAADVLAVLERYNMKEKTIVTSFQLAYLIQFRNATDQWKMGYLTDDCSELTLKVLETIGVGQFCPIASMVDEKLVKMLHDRGFSVRAWGVENEELMQKVYESGADGMTVNFPDKLRELMLRQPR